METKEQSIKELKREYMIKKVGNVRAKALEMIGFNEDLPKKIKEAITDWQWFEAKLKQREESSRLMKEQIVNQLSDIQKKVKYQSLFKRDDVIQGLQDLIGGYN